MKTLGKFLAGICAVLFVLTGVAALLLFNIERKAFASNTYKQAFEKQKLYEQMPSVLANALGTSIAEDENADPYLKSIPQESWEQIIVSILPPDELKALTDDALDSVFAYLNGETEEAVISLLPFKRHLVGDSGVEAVKQLLGAQPDCTNEQLMQMGLNMLSGGDLILCNPPAEAVELMTPLIEKQLQIMTLAFPDEVTLIKSANSGTPNDLRLQLDRVRAMMKLTPLLPLLFLFGLTVFAVRSLAGWLKWWGVPFLVTGALGLLTALIGSPILTRLFERAIQNRGADAIPPVLVSTAQETLSAVTRQILQPVMTEGLILAALGIAMIVVAFLVNKNTPAK